MTAAEGAGGAMGHCTTTCQSGAAGTAHNGAASGGGAIEAHGSYLGVVVRLPPGGPPPPSVATGVAMVPTLEPALERTHCGTPVGGGGRGAGLAVPDGAEAAGPPAAQLEGVGGPEGGWGGGGRCEEAEAAEAATAVALLPALASAQLWS